MANSTITLGFDVKNVSGGFKAIQGDAKALSDFLRDGVVESRNLERSIFGFDRALGKAANSALGLRGNLGRVVSEASRLTGLGGIATQLTSFINPATMAVAAGTAVAATFVKAGKAAAEFEVHLDQLQSLTGLSDNEMKAVSDGAIEMSKEFRSSAGEIVDAMKLIGSQAPELLKNKDALMSVTEAANVLSEAALIPVEDAARALTGVMNQMGVSSAEAGDIINVLAAASQQGAADVAYLNTVFEKAGTNAKDAGMSYVELAAAIETIAPKFSKAEIAGTSLNSLLLKLSMSGNNDFMPSVVGMSTALDNLAKAELNDAEMKKLVGESNVTMLKSLIDGREQFDSFSVSLAGTQTAYEQMATNTDNLEGCINRLSSAWDAFLLVLGQSGIIQGVLDNIMLVMGALGEVINVISEVIKAFEAFKTEGSENVSFLESKIEFLVNVIKGVGTVLEIVVRLVAKAFQEIRDIIGKAGDAISEKWNGVKNSLKDIAFVRTIVNAFQTILRKANEMIAKVKGLWNKFLKWLGMSVKSEAQEGVFLTPDAETGSPASGGNDETDDIKKPKTSKSTTTKTEVVKTQLEIDREKLQEVRKALDLAVSDFNDGLLDKNALIEQARKSNEYFSKNGIKERILLDFSSENGFEKVKKKILNDFEDLQLTLPPIQIDAELKGLDSIRPVENIIDKLNKTQEVIDSTTGSIASMASSFGKLGKAIGGTEGDIVSFGGQVLSQGAQMIQQMVEIITANEAAALAKGMSSAAGLQFPFNLAAIATVVGTITSLFASLPKFADGGIITGPTIGLMGEYAGASSNPEVVAPLDKLKGMLGGAEGGKVRVTGEFKLKNRYLVAAIDNEKRILSKSGRK